MPTEKHPRESREYALAHLDGTTHEFGEQGRQYAVLGTLVRIEGHLALLVEQGDKATIAAVELTADLPAAPQPAEAKPPVKLKAKRTRKTPAKG